MRSTRRRVRGARLEGAVRPVCGGKDEGGQLVEPSRRGGEGEGHQGDDQAHRAWEREHDPERGDGPGQAGLTASLPEPCVVG